MTRIEEILNRVRLIPMLSRSAARILELVGQEEYSIGEVAKVVECDHVLTAQVLKVVNSTAFSLREQITTVNRAIAYLGQKMVIGIALSLCSEHIFERPLEGYESKEGELWRHSLLTAMASKELAGLARAPVDQDLAFTAGLLHDIGKAVLSDFLRGSSREMTERIDSGAVRGFLQAEKEIAGVTHQLVGAALASRWKLPRPLAEVILHHHLPRLAEKKYISLVYVVHLGDLVAMMAGKGTGADDLSYRMDRGYAEYIDINREKLEILMLRVQMEFEKTEAMLFGGERRT
ncbi:MAG: HDOD domain-containing protein [Pseudomonadota bacterium]